MITRAEENYLKSIYHLGQQGRESVSTNSIASRMSTKASSVTDMIKRLADKSLADYTKYKGVSLTKEGQRRAVSVIRKHRLWEVFLVEKLKFSWDEVHDVAEQLEHIKSEKLVDKLDTFLEFPAHDPHGEPIPDKEGRIQDFNYELLATAQVEDRVTCVGVRNTSSAFLIFLDKNKIAIGSFLEILELEPFDQSMIVMINKKKIKLSEMVTNNIYIK